jgi:CPA1 family monovalent cation:H+ antiporter
MNQIEVLLGLLVAVAALAWLASRINIVPDPARARGLAIAAVPGLPSVELDPDLVVLCSCPALLYYAGLLTSWSRLQGQPAGDLAAGGRARAVHDLRRRRRGARAGGTVRGRRVRAGAFVSPPDAVAADGLLGHAAAAVHGRVVHILEG